MAVSKLLLTEFGIHYRLESCEKVYLYGCAIPNPTLNHFISHNLFHLGVLGDKVGFNNAYAIALLMATAGTFFDFIPRFSYLTRQSTVTLAKGSTEGVYFLDSMSFVPGGK